MANEVPPSPETIAAFDLGSNTARGILASGPSDGSLRVLATDDRMTALGAGLTVGRSLSTKGITAVVDFMAETLERWGEPDRAWAIATASARDASNADELFERIMDATGVRAEIVGGEEEARLAWLGALSIDRALAGMSPTVVDIGGRSTEIVSEEGGRLQARSHPFGARSLSEKVAQRGLPWLRARAMISGAIGMYLEDEMPRLGDSSALVCIGGTAQAAAKLVGEYHLTFGDVTGLADELGLLSLEERRVRMPFDPDRAEIICAGLALLALFAAAASDQTIIVSEGGVREGLLLDRTGAERLVW